MLDQIREAEWRILREIKPIALERFCERILSEVSRLASDTDKSAHERYLAIFKLMDQKDDEIANGFNDMRRSTAMRRLAFIKYLDLLTEDEMARFSPETREFVDFLVTTID
jgi:hypothetical protein